MVKHILIIICLTGLALSGCTNKTPAQMSSEQNEAIDSTKIHTKHAKGFSVEYIDNDICLVEISDPQNAESTKYKYALVKKGAESTVNIPDGYTRVGYPINKVVCMTSLQLSNFIKLDETDAVVGVTSTRHLFNEKINERIDAGQTARVGIEGNFDSELIMSISPDIILISPFKRGGYEQLKDVGIPLIPHLGYKEHTPLGQAEWIKFIGLLLGKTEKANAIFSQIEEKYTALKGLAQNVDYRPMVLSGETRGGAWYAPGGQSFLAKLFTDAGAEYFLSDDKDTGGKNLDFETVYSRAANAEYWRILNSYKGTFSYEALADDDERYEDFKAFQDKGIIYCNMSEKPFYESMPTEPEVILADFIHVFHPNILPDHQPVYYSLLK